MKNDGLTKNQRYNIDRPVISFRGDPEMKSVLDVVSKKENKSRNKLIYDVIKNYVQSNHNIKIKYVYEEGLI